MFGFLSPKVRGSNAASQLVSTIGLGFDTLESREVPAVISAPDQYQVQAGQVLTISAFVPDVNTGKIGVLSNDFSTTNPNAILTAVRQSAAISSNNGLPAPALPTNSLRFDANGGFTFVAPSNYDTNFGPVTFSYNAIDLNSNDLPSVAVTVTITIVAATTSQSLFAVAAGPGTEPRVRVFESTTGIERFSLLAYEQSFTGGVRVATGDVNRDGVDDIITVPASGGSARVKVFDGKTGVVLEDFFAFESIFRGGAEIAIGDIQADGFNDIIVGAGNGGGPRVIVYDGSKFGTGTLSASVLANFFAYEDTFRNGVRVAAGNVDGLTGVDRRDFIITGAGEGGGPAVKVYDGRLVPGFTEPLAKRAFFAFDSNNRDGVNVAVGQFRGDGKSDIVVGNSSGSAIIRVFDGRNSAQLREVILTQNDGTLGAGGVSGTGGSVGGTSNFGGSSGGLVTGSGISGNGNGGVRVAVTDRNGNAISDIIAGPGSGQIARLRILDGNSLSELSNFLAFPSDFLGGIFVGGNSLTIR